MGKDLGVGSSQEVHDDVSAVSWGTIMVKPKRLPSPQVGSAPSQLLPQLPHGAQIDVSIHPLASSDKLAMNDPLAVPENDQHHFPDIAILEDLLWTPLIAAQPG